MNKISTTLLLIVLVVSLVAISEFRADDGIEVEDITIRTNNRSLAGIYAYPSGDHGVNTLPAVAVFHGFTATKEMMRPFVEGLARVGFAVLAIDQQGHGFSSGYLGEDGNNSLRNDGVSIIEYLRDQDEIDSSRIAILGHSMGARTAIATSAYLGDLQATVILGNSLTDIEDYNVSPSFPENVFMGIGKYDELFTVDDTLTSFSHLISVEPEIDKTYGDFSMGTARQLTVAATDHILEVLNKELIEESIEWIYKSLIDPDVGLSDPELESVNGWTYVIDQLFTALASLCIIGLILASFNWFPQLRTQPDEAIAWKIHGSLGFVSFMMALPLVVILDTNFSLLFISWYFLGFVFYSILQFQRTDQTFFETVKSSFILRQDVLFAVFAFSIVFISVQSILQLVHWDFRYVLPVLSGLSARRLVLFFVLLIPGIFFFTMEIAALQGTQLFSYSQLGKEIAARIWLFTVLLLLYYVPIIFFQNPILPPLIGFLVFFIVALVPVMIILSVISSYGRSRGWSPLALAIISSGIIAWMLASTLSFNA